MYKMAIIKRNNIFTKIKKTIKKIIIVNVENGIIKAKSENL